MKKIFFSVFLSSVCSISNGAEFTPTGFVYPLRRDSFNTERGFWLNPPNGTRRSSDCEIIVINNRDHCENPNIYGSYIISGTFHAAIDMMADDMDERDNVYAIADGEIKGLSENGWGDNDNNAAIIIRHKKYNGNYFYALYGHISKSTAKSSGTIRMGEKIGEIGDYSNGNHLHFAIRDTDSTFVHRGFGTPPISDWPASWTGEKLEREGNLRGLVNPVWFINKNIPDNWISKNEIDPSSIPGPINHTNPWFFDICVTGYDERCDLNSVGAFLECADGSSLCPPPEGLPYWIERSHHFISGDSGGGYTPGNRVDLTEDFKIYVESGSEIISGTETLSPNQNVELVLATEVHNDDTENHLRDQDTSNIEAPIWYWLDGESQRSQLIDEKEFDVFKLEKDDSPKKRERFIIPNKPGRTIYFQACVDGNDEVYEEDEENNCSSVKSYEIAQDISWLLPTIEIIFSDEDGPGFELIFSDGFENTE